MMYMDRCQEAVPWEDAVGHVDLCMNLTSMPEYLVIPPGCDQGRVILHDIYIMCAQHVPSGNGWVANAATWLDHQVGSRAPGCCPCTVCTVQRSPSSAP